MASLEACVPRLASGDWSAALLGERIGERIGVCGARTPCGAASLHDGHNARENLPAAATPSGVPRAPKSRNARNLKPRARPAHLWNRLPERHSAAMGERCLLRVSAQARAAGVRRRRSRRARRRGRRARGRGQRSKLHTRTVGRGPGASHWGACGPRRRGRSERARRCGARSARNLR